jgi:hypothetical protein
MRTHKAISELDLDRAIAEKIASSQDFRTWLLKQTKFASDASDALLLIDEQIAAKPKKKPENWWRHWWCELGPGDGSETDIFVVFGFPNSNRRIALHIEDKPPHGKFEPNQHVNYGRRAKHMANNPNYMDYGDYATILIAPESFLAKNAAEVGHFDTRISYESIASEIPLIHSALVAAASNKM